MILYTVVYYCYRIHLVNMYIVYCTSPLRPSGGLVSPRPSPLTPLLLGKRASEISIVLEAPIPKRSFGDEIFLYVMNRF